VQGTGQGGLDLNSEEEPADGDGELYRKVVSLCASRRFQKEVREREGISFYHTEVLHFDGRCLCKEVEGGIERDFDYGGYNSALTGKSRLYLYPR
jgi:hypothetical protein